MEIAESIDENRLSAGSKCCLQSRAERTWALNCPADDTSEHKAVLGLQILEFSFHFVAFVGQFIVRSSNPTLSISHSERLLQMSFFFDEELDAMPEVLNSKAVLALVVVNCAYEIMKDRSSVVKIGKVESAI